MSRLRDAIERFLFAHRRPVLLAFAALTLGMVVLASRLTVDAGFLKLLPLGHPYMKTFVQYQGEFGGANRVLVALVARDGDIFTAGFFEKLRAVTDEVFFTPGVDRGQVRSLFTPNVRFVEIVEGGFTGGDVVPADFRGTAEDLVRVRENVLKSGQVGRLVANDFSAALVSAQLVEIDPATGRRLDYFQVARHLEEIRGRHESDSVSVHVLGFAKMVGDIADGARSVVAFFGIALLLTAILVRLYAGSWRLGLPPLLCSLAAVAWQLGMLPLLGFGIDPLSLLVPFLVLAIGVSHGVQMVTEFRLARERGAAPEQAAREGFRRLFLPGGLALVTDVAGFLTMLLIGIQVIQETAITASLGLAVLILTNLLVLPLLLSHVRADVTSDRARFSATRLWDGVTGLTRRGPAAVVIAISALLLVVGLGVGSRIRIGDLKPGVPELHADSRYNLDAEQVVRRFSIGVDVITVIAETEPEGCIDHGAMDAVDRLAWRLDNVDGVRSTLTLPAVAKVLNAGWNEGSLKWRVLPRDPQALAQSVSRVETATGLLNADCSAMPIMVFTEDHKAETIERVLAAVGEFQQGEDASNVRFRLATGNVGVMAATNETVRAAQFPMLLYIYAVVVILCLLVFRSPLGTACIVLPLVLTSAIGYALMTWLEIGLKVSTLPVVALGTGIGVDYGIYVYARFMQERRFSDLPFREAMATALRTTGNAVLFTGFTLAAGAFTWIFSALRLQADMGLLLTVMFLVNMVGAVVLLPSLAAWLVAGRGGTAPKGRPAS